MKLDLRQTIFANMLLDLLPLGWAVYATVVGASATNVPDAGLVVVVTAPLMVLVGIDLLVLYGLGVKRPSPKKSTLLLAYYALTRVTLTYVLVRLLINSSVVMVVALAAMLVVAAYTLRSIEAAR